MKSGRNYNALDAMKFVASLFVVGIHVHPFGDFSGKADYLFIVLARFAVPFFFVTSGFLLFKRLKSEENPNRYVKSYVMRILKMYLFWFIVDIPMTYARKLQPIGEEGSNALAELAGFCKNAVLTSTFRGSWFLTATIYGILLVWLLSRKCGNRTIIGAGLLLYGLCILSSAYAEIFKASGGWQIYKVYKEITGGAAYNRWPAGFLFLALGKWFADNEQRLPITRKTAFFGCIVSVYLMMLEMTFLKKQEIVGASDCFVSLIPLSVFLCALLLHTQLPDNLIYRKMRVASTVTFYAHFMLLFVFEGIKDRFGMAPEKLVRYGMIVLLCWGITELILRLEKIRGFGWLKYSH